MSGFDIITTLLYIDFILRSCFCECGGTYICKEHKTQAHVWLKIERILKSGQVDKRDDTMKNGKFGRKREKQSKIFKATFENLKAKV